MKRNPAGTRARILDAAYALFFRTGFQRTSLDDIAAKAGVTKRTLYYHVRSKDDLASEVLERQHAFVLDQVGDWIGKPTTSKAGARKMIDRLFAGVDRWVKSAGPRAHWTGSGFTRMAVELADLPGHPARTATRRHKAAIQAEFARHLKSCGVRRSADIAAQLQIILEGTILMTLIHGDNGYARLAAAAARKLV